jgi:anti-sigma-K factor RskA
MNCELYDDLLDDYVDRVRTPDHRSGGRFAAFEQHLAGCTRCQALVADLTSIRLAASTLDEHIPPPRLWARIASSIDEQQRQSWWQRQLDGVFSAWVPAVAAASMIVLLVAGIWGVWQQRRVETPQQVAAPLSEPESVPAEQHYEQAIAGLQQLADAQNAALDPETRAVLTKNLAVIDRAINESRAALAQEPASTLAQESLLDALETKVALLQDTVALASDSGWTPEEAAGAAKELNQ